MEIKGVISNGEYAEITYLYDASFHKIWFSVSAYGGFYTMVESEPSISLLSLANAELLNNSKQHGGNIWIHSGDNILQRGCLSLYHVVPGGLEELVDFVCKNLTFACGDNTIFRGI